MKVLFTERQREFKKARPLTGFMCTTVKLLYILLGSVISKVYDKRFAIFIFIRPLIENSGSNFYPVYGRPLSIMAQSIPSVPIDPPPPPHLSGICHLVGSCGGGLSENLCPGVWHLSILLGAVNNNVVPFSIFNNSSL